MSITKICPVCQKEFNPSINRGLTCGKECGYKLRARSAPSLKPVASRFWLKVNKTDTCWLWTGTLHSEGYGRISIGGKAKLAHRISYQMLRGEIPDGLDLDHLCRIRNCVNPDHLEPVTPSENSHRQARPKAHNKRTHCRRGHLYLDNVYTDKNGKRHCKLCDKLWFLENSRTKVS